VKFATSVYNVNFRLFDKVDVIGDRSSPLWTFLKGICLHCLMCCLFLFIVQMCASTVTWSGKLEWQFNFYFSYNRNPSDKTLILSDFWYQISNSGIQQKMNIWSMCQHYAWLASAFVYVVMVFPVFIVLFFIGWTVLIVIYCDFLCCLVYRTQGCINVDLT